LVVYHNVTHLRFLRLRHAEGRGKKKRAREKEERREENKKKHNEEKTNRGYGEKIVTIRYSSLMVCQLSGKARPATCSGYEMEKGKGEKREKKRKKPREGNHPMA